MIELHNSKDRGSSSTDWLKSRHSFSFNEWYNPQRMGFGALRVLNDDEIAPGEGFGMHGHKDMEIVTIVLSGKLAHRDSIGSSGTIAAGEVQRMSAGSGIMHSELNASFDEPVHLLQIWVETKQKGIKPSYEQKSFAKQQSKLVRIVDPEGVDGALRINQDATFWLGDFKAGEEIALNTTRPSYVFVIFGSADVNGKMLQERDAAAVRDEQELRITFPSDAKILIIELPRS